MSYTGPTLSPKRFLEAIASEASEHGFKTEILGTVGPYPIYWLEKPADGEAVISVFISAGVHGDEPAAPLTIQKLLGEGFFDSRPEIHWKISPMLNPTGFAANTRENADGIDINRDFRNTLTQEARLLKSKLETGDPSDLALLVHEDWESSGFYLYDLSSNPTSNPARSMVDAVSKIGEVDQKDEIDGMPAQGGIISVKIEEAESDPKLEGNGQKHFISNT